jgi:hypothetical protein
MVLLVSPPFLKGDIGGLQFSSYFVELIAIPVFQTGNCPWRTLNPLISPAQIPLRLKILSLFPPVVVNER